MPAWRAVVLTVIGMVGLAPILNGQHIRIGNAGAIPNRATLPPTILKSTIAPYPNEARILGIEGTVTLEAQVDIEGRVKVLRVLKGLRTDLDQVAASTVGEWTLSPAIRNGVPAAVTCQIDVEFSLRSANAFAIAAGMTGPKVLHKVEPEYTNEARKAGRYGFVILQTVITTEGTAQVLSVLRGLPFGLTEKAIQAVKRWRFSPGTRDGAPVDVFLNIQVSFLPQK